MIKKWKRKALIVLGFIIVIFLIQNNIRSYIDNQQNALLASLSGKDVEYLQQALSVNCSQQADAIIPCGWYGSDGFMPPIVAGMLDGAYNSGMSIIDMAQFMHQYVNDNDFRLKTNKAVSDAWMDRDEVIEALSNSLIEYGQEISGSKGYQYSEYQFGEFVFEAAILLVGVGEISESLKFTKFLNKAAKPITASSKRLQKITRIKKLCVPCAKLFKNTKGLRRKLLSKNNIGETKRILNKKWKKSGKDWNVFIKDYEAHHIIPKNLLETSDAMQFYYKNGGALKFNSLDNGIMLKKVSAKGVHAKHDVYNLEITRRISKIHNSIEDLDIATKIKIKKFDIELHKLTKETKELIIQKCIKKDIKIDNLFD